MLSRRGDRISKRPSRSSSAWPNSASRRQRSASARNQPTPSTFIDSQIFSARKRRVRAMPWSAKFTSSSAGSTSCMYSGRSVNACRSSRPSRTSTQPASKVWASLLCGSSVTESARPMPSSSSRPSGVSTAVQP